MDRDRLPSLTGLRFWAALLVVTYHLSRQYHRLPVVSSLVWYGRDGVTFFFVLSGFVLAWSYAGAAAAVPAQVFYRRRFARVWPLHVLATGFALAVTAGAGTGAVLPWRAVLWSVPLLQAWAPSTVYGGNPAAWSLSAEAWFYLLLPVLLRTLLRRGDRAPALLAATACGCGVALWFAGAYVDSPALRDWLLDYLPLTRTPQFLLGVAAGVAFRRGWRLPVPVGAAVGALVLWHLALVPWSGAVPESRWYGPYSGSQLLVAPLFAALVLAAAARDTDGGRSRASGRSRVGGRAAGGRANGLLARPWMRRLGHWSFAWYLVHQTCLRLALLLFGRPQSTAEAATGWLLVAALSLALAGALHRWVERPLEAALRGSRKPPGEGPDGPGPGLPGPRSAAGPSVSGYCRSV
ncbi:acyltransferase family protein [Streptacidiphilus carbonis]|uniref:acyltransferase family protein n=1 Tax=Streptacidiphilus carbonis TaxID=105422 RepID=UPI0007C80D98|nr:acyltransferase [Streptacidiphilus carbonis]